MTLIRLSGWLLSAMLLGSSQWAGAQGGDLVFRQGFEDGFPGPFTDAEAARFLTQATFGPTPAEIARLRAIGYEQWLDEQFAMPATLHTPLIGFDVHQADRQEIWWQHALTAPDQLRQRMAFALSQIFVVSDRASALAVIDGARALAHYYDLLLNHAFGSYRMLLQEATLSPVMGHYLSLFQSRRPDVALNIRPDENFAREVMQLFSIGLVQLDASGAVIVDNGGDAIPTYGQDQVRGYAHLLSGYNFSSVQFEFQWNFPEPRWFEPMRAFEPYHDTTTTVQILNGVVVPGGVGRNAASDLARTLDSIAEHPNVGPFIVYRLIQRLVTSNPSPAYMTRVVAVWNDDGSGARGNLEAVVRAILMDEEARNGPITDPARFGKLREPLLRLTHLFRALNARAADPSNFRFGYPERVLGQGALRAGSVFNFYAPQHAPPGEIQDAGLTAPEFQITTASLLTTQVNDFEKRLGHDFRAPGDFFWPDYRFDDAAILVDVTPLLAPLLVSADALIDEVNRIFLSGQMSAGMRSILRSYVQAAGNPGALTDATRRELVREVLYLTLTSPEYMVQR
jgi:uncharacterized protein (DUF1800 family)